MTEQEIRDNAPEGATHYSKTYPVVYFKVFRDNIFVALDSSLGLVRSDSHFKIKPL